MGVINGFKQFFSSIYALKDVIVGRYITTVDKDLNLLPATGKITKIGSGVSVEGLASNNDFLVNGQLEIKGVSIFLSSMVLKNNCLIRDNLDFYFGNGADSSLHYSILQTKPSMMVGVSAESRVVVICDQADRNTDFGITVQSDPTLAVQSADATTPAQRVRIQHDQTNGVVTADAGGLELGSATCAPIMPSLTTTERDALTAVNGMIIYNTTTTTIQGYSNGSWVDIGDIT